MKREITTEFTSCNNRKDRRPLLLEGARQVGKTYSILEFAKKNFDKFFH